MQTTSLLKLTQFVLLAYPLAFGPQGLGEQPKALPQGVLKALSEDEKAYCDQFEDKKDCGQEFRANLLWRELEVAPARPPAFLVENHNMGACGSAGCSLFLFVRGRNGEFVQVLGTDGEVGELNQIKASNVKTRGYYNLKKTWRDGNTITVYVWNGSRYLSLSKCAAPSKSTPPTSAVKSANPPAPAHNIIH